MLVIWTSQNEVATLDRVLRQVLPFTKTAHKVVKLKPGEIPALAKGDVLLCMGGKTLDVLKAERIIKKNVGLMALRQEPRPVHDATMLATYDPFMCEVDASSEPEILWDLVQACRLHDTGSIKPPLGEYAWVDNFDEAEKALDDAWTQNTSTPIVLDLETIGLDPWKLADPEEDTPAAQIVSVSITHRVKQAAVNYCLGGVTPALKAQIERIVNHPAAKMVGANLKFDMLWLAVHWDIVIKKQAFDTTIVGSLLNENRSNSLNLHAKIYTAMGGYDDHLNQTYDKGRMDLIPKSDLLPYAGGDTDACMRVYLRQRKELLEDRRLTRFYVDLLQPSVGVFHKMEKRGVLVDLPRYQKLEVEVRAELNRLSKECFDFMPKRLKLKYSDNLSLSRAVILKDFMFSKAGLNLDPLEYTEKSGEPSTAIEHLEQFSDHPVAGPFVKTLSEYNSASKTLSTYIVGFMKHLRSDGRFHPTYMLHRGSYGEKDDNSGTVTGRTSAKDPAYQTIPKHTRWAKPLRSVYIAPPGYAILKMDYSQGELRVTACVANEQSMIQTYRDGIDLHLKTGALVHGISLQEALALKKAAKKGSPEEKFIKEVRQGGKAGNFGLIYGMGVDGFVEYAWKTYGVKMLHQKADEFRNAFFATYPGLTEWHNKYRKLARHQGYVRNPLGRLRHLPLINSKRSDVRSQSERQSINSPIQSCLSDLMQLAMVELDRRYPDLWIFGMTHDDLSCYVPEGEVDLWAARLKEVGQNLPIAHFGWEPQLQFLVDTEYSLTNLAECVEM